MPTATVRGAQINFQVVGQQGPWVTLSPGGRRGMDGVAGIARGIANAGYRVLIHDRRNTGASDVAISPDQPEYEMWADDLHELLRQLGGLPVYAGGSSSGCRTMLLFALRHPEAVRGLLLWRITGGPFAAKRLAQQYYGQFVDAAKSGGMATVCATEHFAERIKENPANRDRLMKMDVGQFVEVMERWRQGFLQSADLPVIGASEDELRGVKVPAIVIPGNDNTHGRKTGETLASLLPNSELRIIAPDHEDVDVADWDNRDPEIASIFVEFLQKQKG